MISENIAELVEVLGLDTMVKEVMDEAEPQLLKESPPYYIDDYYGDIYYTSSPSLNYCDVYYSPDGCCVYYSNRYCGIDHCKPSCYSEPRTPFTESRLPIYVYGGSSIAIQALTAWAYSAFFVGTEEADWYKVMMFATQLTWVQTSFTALWAAVSGHEEDNTRPFSYLWSLVNFQTYFLTTASWAGLAYAQYERAQDQADGTVTDASMWSGRNMIGLGSNILFNLGSFYAHVYL